MCSAALFELSSRGEPGPPLSTTRLLAAGDTFFWCHRPPRDERLGIGFLFRPTDLDVSRVEVRWSSNAKSLEITKTRALKGKRIALDSIPAPEDSDLVRSPPPVSGWFANDCSPRAILASLNRIAYGPLLVLLCFYLTVLIPAGRSWVAYPAYLLIVPAIGLGLLSGSSLLWSGNESAYAAEALGALAATSAVVGLDAAWRRRGLRLD